MDTTNLLKHAVNFLIIMAPFLIVFLLVFRAAQKRLQRRQAVETIEKAFQEMREKITLVTTAGVPGRSIERVLGPVSVEEKAYSGYFGAAEKRALVLLMHRALLMGADAVVELRRDTPLADGRAASRGPVNRIRFFGTAVKLAETDKG